MTTNNIADDNVVSAAHDDARSGAGDPLRGRRRRSTLGAALLMVTVSSIGALGFMVGPASQHFGVATSQYMLYYSLWTIGGGLAMAVGGELARRIGVRRIILLGGLVSTAGLTLMSFAPSMTLIYIGGAVTGVGWGFSTTMAATIVITLWHTKRRGSILGIVIACAGVGGFIWGFVMPRIVEAGTWRAGYAFIAGLALVLIVGSAVFLIRNPPIQDLTATTDPTMKSADKSSTRPAPKLMYVLIFGAAFLMALTQAVQQVLPNLLQVKGLSATEAGVIVSAMFFGTILAKPLLGLVVDRWGLRASLIAGAAASLIAFLGLTAINAQILLAVLAVLIAVSTTPITIVLPIAITTIFGPQKFSSVYGLSMMVLYLGLACGAPLWGLNFDLTGDYTIALVIGGFTTAIGLGMVGMALVRNSRNRAPDSLPEAMPKPA